MTGKDQYIPSITTLFHNSKNLQKIYLPLGTRKFRFYIFNLTCSKFKHFSGSQQWHTITKEKNVYVILLGGNRVYIYPGGEKRMETVIQMRQIV